MFFWRIGEVSEEAFPGLVSCKVTALRSEECQAWCPLKTSYCDPELSSLNDHSDWTVSEWNGGAPWLQWHPVYPPSVHPHYHRHPGHIRPPVSQVLHGQWGHILPALGVLRLNMAVPAAVQEWICQKLDLEQGALGSYSLVALSSVSLAWSSSMTWLRGVLVSVHVFPDHSLTVVVRSLVSLADYT